jgi:hypothetical protein
MAIVAMFAFLSSDYGSLFMMLALVGVSFRLGLVDHAILCADQLVRLRVCLLTNIIARIQCHYHKLAVWSHEQHLSKLIVVEAFLINIGV